MTAPKVLDGSECLLPRPNPATGQGRAVKGKPRRNRRSAKAAGTGFERLIADHLAATVDDRIDRRVKTGAKDCGDIGGVRLLGHRIVIEAKNCTTTSLPAWTREAQTEATNDGALLGVVVHKRHGNAKPGDQWVTMTVDELVKLLKLIPATTP